MKKKNLPKHYRYNYHVRGEWPHIHAVLHLHEYEAIKETPKGYWIQDVKNEWILDKKFVLKSSRKRYAYPTKEEALESLKIRTSRRINYLHRDLMKAKAVLTAILKEQ